MKENQHVEWKQTWQDSTPEHSIRELVDLNKEATLTQRIQEDFEELGI